MSLRTPPIRAESDVVAQLVYAALAGDRGAFAELHRRAHATVRGVLMAKGGMHELPPPTPTPAESVRVLVVPFPIVVDRPAPDPLADVDAVSEPEARGEARPGAATTRPRPHRRSTKTRKDPFGNVDSSSTKTVDPYSAFSKKKKHTRQPDAYDVFNSKRRKTPPPPPPVPTDDLSNPFR